MEEETAFVPSVWPLEIGNILVLAERRKRISYAQLVQYIELMDKLPIQIDEETALFLSFRNDLLTRSSAYMFEEPIMSREYFHALADTFRSPHLWVWEEGSWKLRHAVWHEQHKK